MINVEFFSCAGGMAEGFRRAGIGFDMAVDFAKDHCDSYEKNIGHRPIRMDVRDLLRMVKLGWRVEIDLLVADPPCTPWSRAGKRLGTADERDMLEITCELIALLGPRRYLIGNVPGLDDNVNLPIVQRVIGGLAAHGYCTADFMRLDAADYGVPQHRIRPFWFGHREGHCIRWPAPTHGDPASAAVHSPLPGFATLRPWVTCREALGHLEGDDLGRPVKMRKRQQNSDQHGSVVERPARTVGTSNLSDGNVISFDPHHPPSFIDEPAMKVRAGCGGATRGLQLESRHTTPVHTSEIDSPARSITTQCRAPGHATTLTLNERHAPAMMEAPSSTVGAIPRGQGAQVLMADRKKRPPPKVPQRDRVNALDAPAATVLTDTNREQSSSPKLEWPWTRPWTRPSTTVTARPGLPPPGHHNEDFAIMSLPDAILLSELAATILQGFPESWVFAGATKKARWSQIGQAMPPPLAEAVARAIVEQDEAAKRGAA